uniref:ABC transporter domain-containing protein n=1 Tax=Rhabditophanes sp. KR3021 TaxID=114890 RepID=A0AC35UCL1_9BILA
MLLVHCFVLLLATWYVDAVLPRGDGIGLKWYFFLTPDYWGCGKEKPTTIDGDNLQVDNCLYREEVETSEEPLIKIQSLWKSYEENTISHLKKSIQGDSLTYAVKNLSMNIYEHKIMALLGHNGAGKTSCIKVLTGVHSPTKGNVFINNLDIKTRMSDIRKDLGFCPQHNILLNFLTPMEHLQFFCELKGQVFYKAEALELLRKIQMVDKQNFKAEKLSGGQKRKLSLAIALIGSSKIIILDEPSAGVDVHSCREIWNLLLAEKLHRTILITTHYMEEADVLSDRIAIMANGKLQCVGSPLYLKKTFGAGYHLNAQFIEHDGRRDIVDRNVDNVFNLLKLHCPEVRLQSHYAEHAIYVLSDKYRSFFPEMLEELERHKKNLGVLSYGISISTMDEVFLKVTSMESDKFAHNNLEDADGNEVEAIMDTTEETPTKYNLMQGPSNVRIGIEYVMACLLPIINLNDILGKSYQNVDLDYVDPDTVVYNDVANFIIFIVQGFFFWVVTFLFELEKLNFLIPGCSCFSKSQKSRGPGVDMQDDDVIEEIDYVNTCESSSHAVVVKNLKKSYGSHDAVRGVSFHVDYSQIFGLLGVNGAGRVDPQAKRLIWEVLRTVQKKNTAIILTSHSMEEIEVLCSTMTIMIAGKFRCYGSPQHIKNKYGSGYSVVFKVNSKTNVSQMLERKPPIIPPSKKVLYHIVQVPWQKKEVVEELLWRRHVYNNAVFSLRNIFKEEVEMKERAGLGLEALRLQEKEELDSRILENETNLLNARKERVDKEVQDLSQVKERILSDIEATIEKEDRNVVERRKEVLQLVAESANFVTKENLDEKLNEALESPITFDFAIDKSNLNSRISK